MDTNTTATTSNLDNHRSSSAEQEKSQELVEVWLPKMGENGQAEWVRKMVRRIAPEEWEKFRREQLAVWEHTYRND